MKVVLTLLQWLLSGLTMLLLLAAVLRGQVASILVYTIALMAVLPPLQRLIGSRLTFWKSRAITLMAWLVLFIVGVMVGTSDFVALRQMAVCPEPVNGGCSDTPAYFVEQTNPLFLTLETNGKSAFSVQLEVNYRAQPQSAETIATETVEIQPEGQLTQVQLPIETLPVGMYSVKLSDLEDSEIEVVDNSTRFSVWPSEEDIASRLDESLADETIKVNGLKLCDGTDEADDCATQDVTEFPGDIGIIDAIATLGSTSSNGKVKYMWRLNVDGTFVEVTGDTVDIEQGTDKVIYSLSSGEESFPEGEYEVIVFAETYDAQPLRQVFTIGPADAA